MNDASRPPAPVFTRRLGVNLDAQLEQRLRVRAALEGMMVSALVRHLIRQGLREYDQRDARQEVPFDQGAKGV